MPSAFFRLLIPTGLSLVLACRASVDAAPPGVLSGHLKIFSAREVRLADGSVPAPTADLNAEYPLIILSGDGKAEIARVTADENGNFRASLPPGEYVLDVQGRAPGHVRAKPRRFEVISGETTRVDLDIDIGVR